MIDQPGWFFQPLRHLLAATSLDERRCTLCHIPFSPAVRIHLLPYAGRTASGDIEDESGFITPELDDLPLCPACRLLLRPRRSGFCPRCGQIYPRADSPGALCGECLASRPPWRHFRFYGTYAGGLKTLLLRGKYGADPSVLHLLGLLLAHACRDLPTPDAIVPVPLHPTRLRERGFNQSMELARPLTVRLSAPLAPQLLHRCLPTPHQVGLSREERRVNLQRAFNAHPLVRRKHILLIDDTFTTGTTLRRASLALLERGASAVDVAVVARTPKESASNDF